MSLANVTALPDVTGLIQLVDLVIRKVTGRKYKPSFFTPAAAKNNKTLRMAERMNNEFLGFS